MTLMVTPLPGNTVYVKYLTNQKPNFRLQIQRFMIHRFYKAFIVPFFSLQTISSEISKRKHPTARHIKLHLLFYCLAIACIAEAQSEIITENFPKRRDDAAFIFHSPTGTLMLLGGTTPTPDQRESDVWRWNGKKWTKIAASGPGSRNFFTPALDTKNNKFFGYGGEGSDERSFGDMWSFDGIAWSKEVSDDIGTRDHHKMVFAEHLNAFVLYGGNRNGKEDTTTWLFRNGKFTALQIKGPGVRYHSGMVYDKHRKKVILYGGGIKPDEHWEFDGSTWTKITTKINPGRKYYHRMVYCDSQKSVVLHGGWVNQNPRDPENSKTPETWMWNGKEWRKIGEHRLFAMALGYDPVRNVVVGYGLTDNYGKPRDIILSELTNGTWTQVANYGPWIDKR